MTFIIKPITSEIRSAVTEKVTESWRSPYVVSMGVLRDTREQPGFAAMAEKEPVGYVFYSIADNDCEITVLESLVERRGIGGALINAVIEAAKENGCRRVWLVTTNDNIHAIRFYQRFGMSLRTVHINSMDAARKLKPEIPLTGDNDIPIAHEFEFELYI